MRSVVSGVVMALMPVCVAADQYEIANGWFRLAGRDGIVTEMRFDPQGKGAYSGNLVRSFGPVGVAAAEGAEIRVVRDGDTLTLENVSVAMPELRSFRTNYIDAAGLEPGETLGQDFVSDSKFERAGACLPTWNTTTSTVRLTLRRDGPGGEVLATRLIRDVRDSNFYDLEFPRQSAGRYYLELSEGKGRVGWWRNKSPMESGSAFADGQTTSGAFSIRYYPLTEHRGAWRLSLDGNRLGSEFIPAESGAMDELSSRPLFSLVTPWVKSGYDVTDPVTAPFRRFIGSNDQYMPIQQFKRRPYQDHLQKVSFMRAVGNNGYDLNFTFPKTERHLDWEMEEDRMIMNIRSDFAVEVLPHSDSPPAHFPVFFSSDTDTDHLLNAFFYGHAMNFYPAGGIPIGATPSAGQSAWRNMGFISSIWERAAGWRGRETAPVL